MFQLHSRHTEWRGIKSPAWKWPLSTIQVFKLGARSLLAIRWILCAPWWNRTLRAAFNTDWLLLWQRCFRDRSKREIR